MAKIIIVFFFLRSGFKSKIDSQKLDELRECSIITQASHSRVGGTTTVLFFATDSLVDTQQTKTAVKQ